jgi:hypothetical protein
MRFLTFALAIATAQLCTAQAARAVATCIDPVSAATLSRPTAVDVPGFLARFPLGGSGLAAAAEDAVVQDVGNVDRVIDLLRHATTEQRLSLARGLGTAADRCGPYQPTTSRGLRERFAQLGDVQLASTFSSTASRYQTFTSAVQNVQSTAGRCYTGAPPASPEQLQSANMNPGQMLERFPLGGGGLSSEVRALALTDPAVLSALAPATRLASPQQKAAIAAGLAQAANACEVIAPGVTQAIQRFIVALGDTEAERTFVAITGDRAVGAVGAGGFAAPGGGGGGGGPLGTVTTVGVGMQGSGGAPQSGSAQGNRFSFAGNSATLASNSVISRFGISP